MTESLGSQQQQQIQLQQMQQVPEREKVPSF